MKDLDKQDIIIIRFASPQKNRELTSVLSNKYINHQKLGLRYKSKGADDSFKFISPFCLD